MIRKKVNPIVESKYVLYRLEQYHIFDKEKVQLLGV